MTRIELIYNGEVFSKLVDDVDGLRTDIVERITRGEYFWLQADRGEGRLELSDLLIGPGCGVVIVNPIDPRD